MKYPLTKKQRKYLNFIKKYIKENGICPSYEEIKNGCDTKTKSAVFLTVNSLERRGWIKRLPGAARAIIILE
jgi:repressor LexA|tara:strand:+ start:1463 stop:1678 length:216 start_codon:yes stop_codon:yes gene_type:complete